MSKAESGKSKADALKRVYVNGLHQRCVVIIRREGRTTVSLTPSGGSSRRGYIARLKSSDANANGCLLNALASSFAFLAADPELPGIHWADAALAVGCLRRFEQTAATLAAN